MSSSERVLSAAEMDQMTPTERAAAVDGSVVRDWAAVPAEFRHRIETTAQRLMAARSTDV